MNKQTKLKTIIICLSVIAFISIFFNIYFITTRTKPFEQDDDQITNNNENIIDEIINKENEDNNIVEIDEKEKQEPEKEYIYIKGKEEQESKKEYIYKYIEGKETEKEVIVEKTIEVPASSTDAIVKYIDSEGNTKTIGLPSGTTINFSAGEHGTYNAIPSPVTLTDNQQLDITDSIYNPNNIEVNYVFKGFSYSGNTMKCEYSLADNIVNVECIQSANIIRKKDVLYIQLEYLEGTGTQYINTGIKRETNSKYEFEFQFNEISSITYTNVWGCDERERTTQAIDKLYLYTRNSDSKIRLGDKGSYERLKTPISTGQKYHVEIKDEKIILNGTEYTGVQWTNANNSDCIFWTRIQDTSNQDCLSGRFYYYKTWKGSEQKLDLVPAKRISDNALGMLDLVTGNFLTNAGSGVFNQPDTVYIPGINAGKIMASGSYEAGSSLILTAVANDGYTFVGWNDNEQNATREITIGDSKIYTALFTVNN